MKKYSVTRTLDCVAEIEAKSKEDAERIMSESELRGSITFYNEEMSEEINLEMVSDSIDSDLTYEIEGR